MPQNFLYQCIKTAYFQKDGVINRELSDCPAGLTHETDQAGNKYFLWRSLSPSVSSSSSSSASAPLLVGDYRLMEEHLSVYEESTEGMPKSAYHYTATFQNRAGKACRLHVYYNSKNEVMGKPHFVEINPDNSKGKIIGCDVLHEQFKLMASNYCTPRVDELKRQQHALVASHEELYQALENEATQLSKNLNQNKHEYLICLQKIIRVLEQKKNYLSLPHATLRLVNTLKYREKALLSSAPDNKEHKETKIKAARKSDLEPSTVPSTSTQATQDKEFDSMLGQLLQLKKTTSSKVVAMANFTTLSGLAKQILRLEIDVLAKELKPETVPVKYFHNLNPIRKGLEKIALEVLQKLLQEERFADAERLSFCFPLVPKGIMDFALEHRKHNLVDFLLKNKIVSPDYKNFQSQGTRYSSLLDYYLKIELTGPEVISQVINGVDALIKNGVSLITIDARTRLPVVVSLLDPNHPLHEVLLRNRELILNNPLFLRQVNEVLVACLNNLDFSEEERIKVLNVIKRNTLCASMKKKSTLASKAALETSIQRFTTVIDESSWGEDMRRAMNDPEVVALRKMIEEEVKALQFSRVDQKRLDVVLQKGLDQTTEILKLLKKEEMPSFEVFKDKILQRDIDTLRRLPEVKKEIAEAKRSHKVWQCSSIFSPGEQRALEQFKTTKAVENLRNTAATSLGNALSSLKSTLDEHRNMLTGLQTLCDSLQQGKFNLDSGLELMQSFIDNMPDEDDEDTKNEVSSESSPSL